MNLFKLRVDSAKVNAGDWVRNIPGYEGVAFKVRGSRSAIFKEARRRREAAVPKAVLAPDGQIPADVMYRVIGEAIHEAALIDWDGIEWGPDDKPQPYDKAIALEMLTNMDHEETRLVIEYAMGQVGKIEEAKTEEQMGNSEPPSGGTSNGQNMPAQS